MSEQLFVHRHRPEWGRAIVASQGAGRRVYQFEDGRTRVIAHDYWDLMEPVEEGAEGQEGEGQEDGEGGRGGKGSASIRHRTRGYDA